METQVVNAKRIDEAINTDLITAVDSDRNGLIKQSQFVVKKQRDSDLANVILKKMNAGLKAMEKTRKFFVKPLNDQVKAINAKFKEVTEPVEEAKQRLSGSLLAWRAEEQRKLREAQAKAEQQQREAEAKAKAEEERRKNISLAKGGTGENVKSVEVEEVAKPKDNLALRDTTTTRKNLIFAITDVTQIPRRYLFVDTTMIRKAMRAADKLESGMPNLDIPGVEWKIEEIPVY